MPARTDLLLMPDGMIHVRVQELWRISSLSSQSKLVVVPTEAGARAAVWWLYAQPGFLPDCPEFASVWRRLDGLADTESSH